MQNTKNIAHTGWQVTVAGVIVTQLNDRFGLNLTVTEVAVLLGAIATFAASVKGGAIHTKQKRQSVTLKGDEVVDGFVCQSDDEGE